MFCYITNFILWILGVGIGCIIKCFAFEPKTEKYGRWRLILGLVLAQLPILLVKFIWSSNDFIRNLCLVILPVLYVVYIKLLFESYLWQVILLVVFELCCNFMSEIIAQAIMKEEMANLTSFTFDIPIIVKYVAVTYTILSVMFLLVFFLFKRFVLKANYHLKIFYVFSVFPMSQVMMLFAVNKNLFFELTPNGIIAMVGTVVGMVADIVLLVTLLNQQRMQELSVKVNEMEKTWEIEQNHYRDIEARREELAKIRHDMSEQFMVLQELLHQEKYEKAQEMLGILREDVSKTREYIYCADPVVNAILAENEKICREKGISFRYDIQLHKPLQLNPVVICSLFSNMMRNAIAAAGRLTEEEAFVSMKVAVKGEYLHIKVENSYSSKEKKKKERKGYGLSILQTIANKYGGQMEMVADAETYIVHVMVENSEKNEMNPSFL